MDKPTELRTFTIPDSGMTVHVRPISPFAFADGDAIVRKRWEAKGRPFPAVPTYTIKTATGEEETFEHTYKTAQESEETKAQWEAYVDSAYDFTGESGMAVFDIVSILGVVEEPGNDWLEYCAVMGIPLPAKAAARKRAWVKTWVCRSGSDLEALTGEVARISGVSMDLTARAKENFRAKLEGRTD